MLSVPRLAQNVHWGFTVITPAQPSANRVQAVLMLLRKVQMSALYVHLERSQAITVLRRRASNVGRVFSEEAILALGRRHASPVPLARSRTLLE